jgi:hypothetical protein
MNFPPFRIPKHPPPHRTPKVVGLDIYQLNDASILQTRTLTPQDTVAGCLPSYFLARARAFAKGISSCCSWAFLTYHTLGSTFYTSSIGNVHILQLRTITCQRIFDTGIVSPVRRLIAHGRRFVVLSSKSTSLPMRPRSAPTPFPIRASRTNTDAQSWRIPSMSLGCTCVPSLTALAPL